MRTRVDWVLVIMSAVVAAVITIIGLIAIPPTEADILQWTASGTYDPSSGIDSVLTVELAGKTLYTRHAKSLTNFDVEMWFFGPGWRVFAVIFVSVATGAVVHLISSRVCRKKTPVVQHHCYGEQRVSF